MSADSDPEAQSLCAHCRGLSLENLKPYLNGPGNAQSTGYVLHHTSAELEASARCCALCALIEKSLFQALERSQSACGLSGSEDLGLRTSAIVVEPKADSIGKAFPHPPDEGVYLSGLVVKAQHSVGETLIPLRGKVRLYLDGGEPDSHARNNVTGRAKLADPNSDAAFALIRSWISGCNQQHDSCRCALSGEVIDDDRPPPLPTRVLDVENASVKLVHTCGNEGKYAALSHCWGSQDRRPLSTTKQNIAQFLSEVPFSQLPNSFKDAVTVTRKIGLRWLWIDSLCIVQDDQDDWREQSQLMGSIFENAEVTLAASHSMDSRQGFLHQRPVEPPPVHLPSFVVDGDAPAATVLATLRYEGIHDTFPEHGILNERAWATQEWLLSRRIVFFTKGAIVWSCKEITQRETGERCYNISRNLAWTVVVERYSERKLTFAKDRRMALEGLRRELEKKTGYSYAFGIWKEMLPNQLLWQVTEHQTPSNVLGLPSWTWMQVPCGVRFLLVHKAKSLVSNVALSDPPKTLSFRSWTKDAVFVDVIPSSQDADLTAALNEDIARSNIKTTSSMANYLCDQQGRLLGWMVFDFEHQNSSRQAITLVAAMGGLLRRDEETERRTGRVLSKKLRHYWVIGLKRGHDGTFVRVGVGKTYGRQWWEDAILETVRIA